MDSCAGRPERNTNKRSKMSFGKNEGVSRHKDRCFPLLLLFVGGSFCHCTACKRRGFLFVMKKAMLRHNVISNFDRLFCHPTPNAKVI